MADDHDLAILAALNEQQTLGLTGWAEARGDHVQGHSSIEERLSVMLAIRNRTRRPKRFGVGYKAVCLAPSQFSCWTHNPLDGNHVELMERAERVATNQNPADAVLSETIWLAGGIISGIILDTIENANHYYSPRSMVPVGSAPIWAKRDGVILPPLVVVGGQHFYLLP